ncbi:methyltransferase [Bowmanella sp. JS7-9]|uniref:Ribosomal RNA large subunit methyltransferase G n=1 Tax=Pseudobowmanella zhangzhouensis TaxID=1537679 RepID=A0ABW1XLL7_9ALTE|nr:methyltransferase [Bowmanella sp. JS7-9]TBX22016.1 23S rRNA methyltransferase [Bowmanella sp. JS7-9]
MNQANTSLTLNNQTMELLRYPARLQHKSLQAWDAADQYLINHLHESGLIAVNQPLIFNDEFGALGCFLATQQPVWVTDSKVAQLALEQNLARNGLPLEGITQVNSLSPLPYAPLVLLKLPKSVAMLEYQLQQIRQLASPDTQIIAAGKVNQVTSSILALFEKYIGETKTSLAVKKSRLIFSRATAPCIEARADLLSWPLENTPFTLRHHANVFARNQLDIGARFFLEHLPEVSGKQVIDLGCGNGVLGLSLLHNSQPGSLTLVDESYMAVESARLNIETNLPDQASVCQFIWSNCLEQVQQRADTVVCNPPFHQQNTITDHIAWQMFTDSFDRLSKGGELRIVGNRHLDYPQKLKRLFGGYQVVAANNKFSILSAVKK